MTITVSELPDGEYNVRNDIQIGARPTHTYTTIIQRDATLNEFVGHTGLLRLTVEETGRLLQVLTRLPFVEDKVTMARAYGMTFAG